MASLASTDSARDSDLVLERLTKLHPKIIDLSLDRTWRHGLSGILQSSIIRS